MINRGKYANYQFDDLLAVIELARDELVINDMLSYPLHPRLRLGLFRLKWLVANARHAYRRG